MTLRLPRGEVRASKLHFDTPNDWNEALSQGIFFAAVPPDLDVAAGVRFCESFHLPLGDKDDRYRGYRTRPIDGTVLGYSDTGNDQVERVQIELHLWNRSLPPELARMLHAMNDMGRAIVRSEFDRCGVNPDDVARITGGMNSNETLQYGIFNNFQSHKQGLVGFTPHKDSGFVQLMYIAESGLELSVNDEWIAVEPPPGCLTAITGHSLEVLTARMPVRAKAAYHRVREVDCRVPGQADRTSFGIYVGPRFEQELWQYDEKRELTRFMSFEEFQRKKAHEMGYAFHPAVEAKLQR